MLFEYLTIDDIIYLRPNISLEKQKKLIEENETMFDNIFKDTVRQQFYILNNI